MRLLEDFGFINISLIILPFLVIVLRLGMWSTFSCLSVVALIFCQSEQARIL